MKNSIRFLGAFGSKSKNMSNTSILVDDSIVIDAGNILAPLGNDANKIEHVFLTHSHLDHITDIPFLIDAFFEEREKPLKIYALRETIDNLKKYIFNWDIWPDFCEINLANNNESIQFIEINLDEEIIINNTSLKAIKNNHTTSSCGFLICKEDSCTLFTSDTINSDNIWEELNNNEKIKSLVVDISFPSRLEELAYNSKHFTPKIFSKYLSNLKRDDLSIFAAHIKPTYLEEISKELKKYSILKNGGKIIEDNDILDISNSTIKKTINYEKEVDKLIEIGHSLTSEKNFNTLMEKILLGAKIFSDADGGTLYLLTDDEKHLSFTVVQTDSLNIKMGGTQDKISWPELPLYKNGIENREMVAALCALEGKLINIPDVYDAVGFNFEGTKKFDEGTGYRTKSMLVVPMKDHEDNVIGVLQLLNKKDEDNETIPFTSKDEKLILSMSSQAAVSISNRRLIDDLENLLDSFIKTIATAIDEKSPYTGGHIGRVANITTMLANAINEDNETFADVHYDDDQLKELRVAAWMHDIGKITTPEYVVDKATKLETIHDRINTVKAKFEILKRDKEIAYLKAVIDSNNKKEKDELYQNYKEELANIEDDLAFIESINFGGEFMADDKIKKLNKISKYRICLNNNKENILTENEVYNLSIKKGTLTDEERQVINNHALMSIKMLEPLPFPRKLKNVPQIAGGHHEKIGGGGYPFGLKGDEISLEARILAIADIFEALTAHDRPYKKANTLNQSLRILSFMVKDNELDKDLVKFFIKKDLHLKYAEKNLKEEQLDEINVDFENL